MTLAKPISAAVGLVLALCAAPALGPAPVSAAAAAAGDVLFEAGDLDGAEREYEAALAADKRDCDAGLGMTRVAIARKDFAGAVEQAKRMDGEKSCADHAQLGLGLLRLAEGKLDDAEALFYKVSNSDPAPRLKREVELAMVALYEAKDYPAMVVEHIDQVLAIEPQSAPLHLKKGRVLVEMKDYDGALAAFRAAIESDPKQAEAYEEAATLFVRAKRPADAAETLTALATVRNDVASHVAAAEAWSAAERHAEAAQAYQRATLADSTSVAAWLGLARSAFAAGDRPTGLAAYQMLAAGAALDLADYMNIGKALLDNKQYPEALDAYSRAVALDSTSADAHFYAGYVSFATQKYADAIPHFECAVAIDSTRAAAYVNLGLSYLQTGRAKDGIATLETALARRPDDVATRLYLAQSLAGQSAWSRATREYRTILESQPQNAEALRGLGYCMLSTEQFGEAIRVLGKANAADPGNVQGLVWLAQGHGLAGDVAQSETVFRRVLAIDPGNADATEGLNLIKQSRAGKRKTG